MRSEAYGIRTGKREREDGFAADSGNLLGVDKSGQADK